MTKTQIDHVERRLDQHADATEIILDRLDAIDRNCKIMLRRIEQIKGRIRKLESIVLPDPDKPCSARPRQIPP